jgi:hypothetical protein
MTKKVHHNPNNVSTDSAENTRHSEKPGQNLADHIVQVTFKGATPGPGCTKEI